MLSLAKFIKKYDHISLLYLN